MKRIVFALVISLFAFNFSNAQFGDGGGEVYLNGDLIDAKFNGGDFNKFYEYVIENFNVSTVEKKGQIIFTFNVNELGEVKNIRILRDLGTNSAIELIRVLKKAPKWEPARRGGKPISVQFKMPLTFN
jgi:hypothetical protein